MAQKEPNGKGGKGGKTPLEEYAQWKEELGQPRERFLKVSHISVCMVYDLVDKLRWYEKETMKRDDDEIEKRLPHMIAFLDRLTAAYLKFSDTDI